MRKLTIKIFLEEGGKMPQRGKAGDAGLDVFAHLPNGPITVSQGESAKIPLGFRYSFWSGTDYRYDPEKDEVVVGCDVSNDFYFEIANRSGIGLRNGFTELSRICDAGYRGVPHYCIAKITPGTCVVNDGDKIAQMLLHPFVDPYLVKIVQVNSIEELGLTDRAANGFGSSGT